MMSSGGKFLCNKFFSQKFCVEIFLQANKYFEALTSHSTQQQISLF